MQPVANVLSVGLSDLVSTRNASLRRAGFEVVAATSLEEAFEACESWLFDVIVVGHTLSAREKALLIRRAKTDFHLPAVLITGSWFLDSNRADAYVRADAPAEDLFRAITQLTNQCAGQQRLNGFEELADLKRAIGEPRAVVGSSETMPVNVYEKQRA